MPRRSHTSTVHVVSAEHATTWGRAWANARCGRPRSWGELALTVEAARNLGRVCKACERVYCAQEARHAQA